MGPTCEFCARYGVRSQQAPPQQWQPPAWQPPQYSAAPAYPGSSGYAPVDTGINPLELEWGRTRVTWVWVLIAAISVLTLVLRWIIANDPQVVLAMGVSLLIDPAKWSSGDQTQVAIWQVLGFFVLSWIPLAGLVLHSFLSQPQSGIEALASATDLSPMLFQGLVYLALAVLIWRRSMIALTVAVVLFLADSGIYTYAVLRLFQGLWELSQNFVQMTQQYPSLGTQSNPYDLVHWPWGLAVPIVVRGAILWFLATSFSGMGVVRLDRARRKAAREEAEALGQAA
jgi:hypothetical protein